jgi:hypothetical protein
LCSTSCIVQHRIFVDVGDALWYIANVLILYRKIKIQ